MFYYVFSDICGLYTDYKYKFVYNEEDSSVKFLYVPELESRGVVISGSFVDKWETFSSDKNKLRLLGFIYSVDNNYLFKNLFRYRICEMN